MVTPNLFGLMLTPSKVGVVQIWKVIESFEFLDSLQFSKTFNFSAIDFDKDSMLVLTIEGSATGGNITPTITINGITSGDYFQDGDRVDTFPLSKTIIDVNNANAWEIPNIIDNTRAGTIILYFQLNKAGSSQFVGIQINANRMSALSGGASYKTTGKLNQNISSISSITVTTFVTNRFWTQGTRMSLYKVTR